VVDPVPWPALPPGNQAGDLDARLAGAAERVGHAARLLLRAAASRQGLSITQAQLLLRLASGGTRASRSMAAMTRWFDVSQPTISDAVTALQVKGLVTKTRRGRAQHLDLTVTGTAAVAELTGWDRPLREALGQHPIETRGVVLEVLLDVIGRLHAAEIVTVARTCTTCRFFEPAALSPSSPDGRRPEPDRESAGSHRCGLLGIPLASTQLRLDCAEHEPRAVSAG
jgi:DNA-binding MarR family transcriptional regulator